MSYATLGSILLWTRLAGLDRSYWHDEIVAVALYVRSGPHEILAGSGLSHEFFSLLTWATTSAVGESETVVRLSAAVPFILGVVVVTAWLHIRLGALSGVLFLFLATGSPLLLDVTRQARGYGLGFLAMGALLIAALEANRSHRTWAIAAFLGAGLVGSWTLPNLALPFLVTGAVLMFDRGLKRRVAIGLGAAVFAIGLFYAPHTSELSDVSGWHYGSPIGVTGLLTAPFDQILLPGLLRIDGEPPVESFLWLPIVALVLLPISASPLLRTRRTALIVSSGVVTTVIALWATGTYVVPRYLSFLLVPLLMLLATGMASILGRWRTRPKWFRLLVVVTILMVVGFAFVSAAARVMRLPREAHKDAAAVIRGEASLPSHVFAYMLQPGDLAFYLKQPVTNVRSPAAVSRLCSLRQETVLVDQPWRLPPLDVPCLTRPGTRHYRFEQYARGGEMNVYLIPPAR